MIDSVQSFYQEVDRIANNSIDRVLELLIERMSMPLILDHEPVQPTTKICEKHTLLQDNCKGFGSLVTRYRRLFGENDVSKEDFDKVKRNYVDAKKEFHSAQCTCNYISFDSSDNLTV